MLEALLLFKYEEEDRLVKRIAIQAAGIMQSSGNLKKSTSTDNLIDSIYAPLIDTEATEKTSHKVITDQDEAKKVVAEIQAKINRQ